MNTPVLCVTDSVRQTVLHEAEDQALFFPLDLFFNNLKASEEKCPQI